MRFVDASTTPFLFSPFFFFFFCFSSCFSLNSTAADSTIGETEGQHGRTRGSNNSREKNFLEPAKPVQRRTDEDLSWCGSASLSQKKFFFSLKEERDGQSLGSPNLLLSCVMADSCLSQRLGSPSQKKQSKVIKQHH